MPANSLALRVSLDCAVALKTKIVVIASVVPRHFTEIPKRRLYQRMREGNLLERECVSWERFIHLSFLTQRDQIVYLGASIAWSGVGWS
jgi:hypothetical protein